MRISICDAFSAPEPRVAQESTVVGTCNTNKKHTHVTHMSCQCHVTESESGIRESENELLEENHETREVRKDELVMIHDNDDSMIDSAAS